MAVLPKQFYSSPSPKHSLFLRLFFSLMVVMACPSWEKVHADEPSSEQVFDDFDDKNILYDFEDFDDFDDKIRLDDEELDDDNIPLDAEEFDDGEETVSSLPQTFSDTLTSSTPVPDSDNGSVGADGISTGIPMELIQPTGTTLGVSQTTLTSDPDGSDDNSSVAVSEEFSTFSIEPSSLSSSSLDQETESVYTQTLTSEDKSVFYRTRTTTERVTLPEHKTITAPVVKFLVSKKKDKKTGQIKEVIKLEDNQLRLDDYGKRGVLIDASALPASYQSSAILQLSLRYRKHCGVEPGAWDSPWNSPLNAAKDFMMDAGDSVASHMIYQESSVKPFSASRNLYLLQVDLCSERKGQIFSLYFTKEKSIRSMISKIGSVASYIIAAKVAGQFVAERERTDAVAERDAVAEIERTDAQVKPYRIPDGDNGGFMDTFASALPAGAVFNGVGYLREEIERWNLSGYDSDISACVTSGLMVAAMNTLDSDFTSDTSQMFVSNAGRLYSRAAFFGELYSCLKTTVVDRLIYDHTSSHNASDPESEKLSSTTTSVLSTLFMYSYDFVDQAEMDIMARQEIVNNKGLNKLERTQVGNIVRGGSASTPYKALDTLDTHYNLMVDDSWSSYFSQMGAHAAIWMAALTTLHYSRPYELRGILSLSQQMLNTKSLFAANIMEAATAYSFGLFDKHISQPVSGYLADSAVSYNLTVPDSWMYTGIKSGVRFAINAGTAYFGINAINYMGSKAKKHYFPLKPGPGINNPRVAAKNSRYFIDVVTGTMTNGVVLPLVFSLDQDVFTPISDGASYFLCSPKGFSYGCPTKELQLGIVVDKTGSLAETHELQLVTSD